MPHFILCCLHRDTTYYISQLRTLLVPALILLGLHLVLSVVLITATAKVLIQPRMWLVMALLILQGLMCGAVMTVMLFYWNVWSTWDAVTTQQLAAYDMHARFFRSHNIRGTGHRSAAWSPTSIHGHPTPTESNRMAAHSLATSVCQPRHDQMEQGPTEPHAGRSTFLLSSGGAGGRVLLSGR